MEYKITRSPTDDSLMHYGVPGMKWGVRKQRYYEKKGIKIKNEEEYQHLKKKGFFKYHDIGYHSGSKKLRKEYADRANKALKEYRNSKKPKKLTPTEIFVRNLNDARKITGNSSLDGNTILKTKIGKEITKKWEREVGNRYDFREDTSYYKEVYHEYFKSLGLDDTK